ncbi:unnamed protein product [Adineta ricciae]|uniref:Uncharacterized protein n=1 Tax=Adineta ricciae TaxID=249248 RepID=A0A813QM56_ADIRI|nr:unnamed protein product [Adineta ricciae]CAF1189264.1 unnamed protein product [Adineta ricciae]
MSANTSDSNIIPIYKLYFDDIEEIFFNTVSFKYLYISTFVTVFLTIFSIIILFYRSRTIFFPCLIPFIYSMIFYDIIQLIFIILLKFNLIMIQEKYFSGFCRWPHYLKASSEGGQCLTLIFIYAIRCQKVQYFLKHHSLPNSSRVHSRALTLVCLLVIVYINNWITHLKVEKIHLVMLNRWNSEVSIQEYPMPLYHINDMKLNDYSKFYADLDKYARNYQKLRIIPTNPEKIIHTQKDDSTFEILIKVPYNLFSPQNSTYKNRTRKKPKKIHRKFNKSQIKNMSYRVHRCTYGQRNYFLANFITLIHSFFYLSMIVYYLISVNRYQIPSMDIEYHRALYEKALVLEQNKCAERHRQLMLLAYLRYFQYIIVYCHTTFILIRLVYICSLTILLYFVSSPFKWLPVKMFFYSLFCLVYYSIPVRLTFLFFYLSFSIFSSYISSIFHYILHTKLRFSWRLRRPTIHFHLRFVPYHQSDGNSNEHSKNSFTLDLTSSAYEEHSTSYPNESVVIYDDNTSSQNVITTSNLTSLNQFQQTSL